jgi:hypothetical protein
MEKLSIIIDRSKKEKGISNIKTFIPKKIINIFRVVDNIKELTNTDMNIEIE